MLRASHKLLRPQGRNAYLTIVMGPGLTPDELKKATSLCDSVVPTERPMYELMEAAGFDEIRVEDVSDSFLDVAKGWLREYADHEDELRPLLGDIWDDRQADRRGIVAALEQGLLKRQLVSGRRTAS